MLRGTPLLLCFFVLNTSSRHPEYMWLYKSAFSVLVLCRRQVSTSHLSWSDKGLGPSGRSQRGGSGLRAPKKNLWNDLTCSANGRGGDFTLKHACRCVKRRLPSGCAAFRAANARWWQLLDSCRVVRGFYRSKIPLNNLLRRGETLITSSRPQRGIIEEFLKWLSGRRI